MAEPILMKRLQKLKKKKKKISLQRRWPENPETIWPNIFLQKTRDCLW